MIDYIVYSEFDINEGNVVKIEYPKKTGISETILSSYMIPEGTHNIMNDTFCFIVNKKNNPDENIINEIKETEQNFKNHRKIKYLDLSKSKYYENIKNKGFILKKIYNLNSFSNKWEDLNITKKYIESKETLYFQIHQEEKEKYFKIKIFTLKNNDLNNIEYVYEIPIHSDIQFQKLQKNFCSVYTLDNNQAIGFEFKDEKDLSLINDLFKDSNNLKEIYCNSDENFSNNLFKNNTNIINKNGDNIYFLCMAGTKLDKKIKRGAILKSIAVGTTKLINLNSFKSSCKYLLDQSFNIHYFTVKNEEKINIIRKVITDVFNAFNSLKFKFGTDLSRYERGIYSYLNASNYFTLPTTTNFENISINIQDSVSVELNLADNEEKIFNGSVLELIKIFKEYTMTIYDGILNDVKIIFVGNSSTTCSQLSKLVFGTLCMIGPLGYGFLKRLHPYKNLYDLEFLKIKNCIYGVTNPIFKQKTDSWDILCEINTGHIAISEKYERLTKNINKESDNIFIKELINKINKENLSEYEVEKYFYNYTYHLFKICKEEYFSDDESIKNEINKQSKRKYLMNSSNLYKIENEYCKFRSLISFNNNSFDVIIRHINTLLNRKIIEKEELKLIYNDIENFIEGGNFYINLFLSFITTFTHDFHIFLIGLFSKNNEIKQKVKKIYNILNNDNLGNLLMKKLNYFFLIKLNEIDFNTNEL